MERRYFHAEVVYQGGELICRACRTKVDAMLRSTTPCIIPTTFATIVNQLPILISVYNCKAILIAEIPVSPSTVRLIAFDYADDIADEIESLLEEDVYKCGGALNMSGFYPLSNRTTERVAQWLAEGKLWLDL